MSAEPDAGVPRDPSHQAPLGPEDQELLDNLDLLQNLESARELELLQELSLDR